MNLMNFRYIISALLFVIIVSKGNSDAGAKSHIFILHSYQSGHICGQPQHDGVLAALHESGLDMNDEIELEAYFMDTKRRNNTPELIEAQAKIALRRIHRFKPDILVTIDDNAFRTVAMALIDTPISIVFTGMNGQPEAYHRMKPWLESRNKPGHNITGVYEKLHFINAVRVHTKIFPHVKKIRIFTDQSPTGKAISKQIALEIKEDSVPCDWETTVINSWEQYQREIQFSNIDHNTGLIYPAAVLLKDKNGNTFTAPEIFKWTVQNSKKPELPVNYAFTRMGLFGGAAVDFHAMGNQAGKMVVKILKGTAAADIPVEDAERSALVFNIHRAQQLGILIPDDILMAADEVISVKP